jgi:hypothetical protein
VPRGEPTKVVRLPVWLLDHLEGALAPGESLPEHITRRLAPRQVAPTPFSDKRRCSCTSPTMSKVVTNLCTTCHLVR